jgi:hypothetical protein
MKYIRIAACALITMGGLNQISADSTLTSEELQTATQIISLTDLTEELINDFSQGNTPDMIVECRAGTYLPFTMSLTGEFVALEGADETSLYLKLLQTCYVRCLGEGNFLFSTDLQQWKSHSEFFTGRVEVHVSLQDGVPAAGVDLDLNPS